MITMIVTKPALQRNNQIAQKRKRDCESVEFVSTSTEEGMVNFTKVEACVNTSYNQDAHISNRETKRQALGDTSPFTTAVVMTPTSYCDPTMSPSICSSLTSQSSPFQFCSHQSSHDAICDWTMPPYPTMTSTTEESTVLLMDGEFDLTCVQQWLLEEPDHLARLLIQERSYLPYVFMFEHQQSLKEHMRTILIDWMRDVCTELRLQRSVWYTSVNMVDRFVTLSPSRWTNESTFCTSETIDGEEGIINIVTPSNYQLIGVVCIFIAAKMEGIDVPLLKSLVDLTDNAYTVEQTLEMERLILRTLGWHLRPVTPIAFLPVYLAQIRHTAHQFHMLDAMTVRISEETVIRMLDMLDAAYYSIHSLRFSPSMLTAAVLYVYFPPETAIFQLLAIVTGYTYVDLLPCINLLSACISCPTTKLTQDPDIDPGDTPVEDAKWRQIETWQRATHSPVGLQFTKNSLDPLMLTMSFRCHVDVAHIPVAATRMAMLHECARFEPIQCFVPLVTASLEAEHSPPVLAVDLPPQSNNTQELDESDNEDNAEEEEEISDNENAVNYVDDSDQTSDWDNDRVCESHSDDDSACW